MDLKKELLKSIWYAFTSLDAEQSGKVSKSQLKVLSHNLYTALNIPHDPVALEEHFQDDDEGPVSTQGYMPYLNNYILAKVKEGTYDKETFDDLCWMMTSKKNYQPGVKEGICSERDCFRLFCLFNLLSEERYPLVIIPSEVEYLLKKICVTMSEEWDGKLLDDFLSQDPSLREGMSVWEFLKYMNGGEFLRVPSKGAFSLALDEVFQEMYHNVLKKGYMWKKGHVRRNWNERYFVLKPSVISYYVSEDLKEKKGEIPLDNSCVVEHVPDREGKRCLFCVKTANRSYEISASDQKQRLDWVQAVQTAVRLLKEGKCSLHQDLKLRRREQRSSNQRSRQEMEKAHNVKEMQEKERQEQQIETIIQVQREVEAKRRQEEEKEREHQREVQKELERQLEEAEKARDTMVEEMALKEKEAEYQRKKIEELELIQEKLEVALKAEIQAHQEEEKARQEQESLLKEEEEKLKQLQRLQAEQETLVQRDQPEKQSSQEPSALYTASQELQTLRETRERSDQNLEEAQKKLQQASCHVKKWNVKLNRLMRPISPGERYEPNKHLSVHQAKTVAPQDVSTKTQPEAIQDSHSSEEEQEEGLQEQIEQVFSKWTKPEQ